MPQHVFYHVGIVPVARTSDCRKVRFVVTIPANDAFNAVETVFNVIVVSPQVTILCYSHIVRLRQRYGLLNYFESPRLQPLHFQKFAPCLSCRSIVRLKLYSIVRGWMGIMCVE